MNNKLLFAGLDLGTSSAKLAVYDDSGEVIVEGSKSYPTYYRQPGWAEQSPEDWTRTGSELLQFMAAELGRAAVSLTGLGLSIHCPSLVFVDKDGQALNNLAPIWSDERSASQAQDLLRRIGPKFSGLGLPNASFPAKLAWFIQEKPEITRQAAYALGAKGYLAHWLTGEYATEPSSEPGNEARWKEVMEAVGWPLDKLPPVLPSLESIGFLRGELCQKAGLPKTIPVVIGLNDGACSTLSSGATIPGEATIELATNGVVYLVCAERMAIQDCYDRSFFCWPYLEPCWIVGGQTKCGASAYHWAANLFSGEAPLEIEALISKATESPPGSNGLIFLPYLRGRGTPGDNPNALASLLGLSIRTSKPDLYRAILEGVVFAIREIIAYLEQSNFQITQLYLTGGGGQNPFNRQLIADIIGAPLISTQSKATLGAAMLAAVGVGYFTSMTEAKRAMIKEQTRIEPALASKAIYQDLFENYCRVRDQVASHRDRSYYSPEV